MYENRNNRSKNTSKTKKYIRRFFQSGLLAGFWIQSSYLAEFIHEGIYHLFSSLLFLLILPVFFIYLTVKDTRHPAATAFTMAGALSWAVTLFLTLGAWEKTSSVISEHGMWPVSFFSEKKRKKSDKIVGNLLKKITPGDTVPFEYKNGSIILKARIKHKNKTLSVNYILDTGATLTTISPADVSKLGLTVYEPASNNVMQTAGGEMRYSVVFLDSIQIGKYKIGPLVAAVCANCAQNGSTGLLGLNFTSRFHLIIDNNHARIKLKKLKKWFDNKSEIEFFLKINDVRANEKQDTVDFSANVENKAPVSVFGLVFKCSVLDKNGKILDIQKVRLKELKPHTPVTIKVSSTLSDDINSFQWELERGFWSNR